MLTRLRIPLLVLLATALTLSTDACGAGARHPTAVAPASAVSIRVKASGPGTRLPANFVGLGLEANTLARNEFPATNLADYLRLLGPRGGLLRIGGNSVESFWTSTDQPSPAWSHGRVTPASLRGLAAALRGTGWRVILGVPFKHSTPGRAANEAGYAKRILGPTLAAIEIGNEPNHYGISQASYFSGFERFVHAIEAAVPGLAIAGPGEGREAPGWVNAFVRDEAPHPDVALLTAHEYPLSICNGEHPTIAQLLSTASQRLELAAANTLATGARRLGVAAVMDETNSVVCWGAPGVSNTFASALWILDYGLLLAQHGVSAANFQTRISGCTPYLPLCTHAGSSQLFARPEFYGLLALARIGTGRFLDVTNPAAATLRVFAVRGGGGHLSVVLDNLAGARTVHLTLPAGHGLTVRETVLATSSTGGLAATQGITLGGRTVGTDGRFPARLPASRQVAGSRMTVRLAAHAAVILALS